MKLRFSRLLMAVLLLGIHFAQAATIEDAVVATEKFIPAGKKQYIGTSKKGPCVMNVTLSDGDLGFDAWYQSDVSPDGTLADSYQFEMPAMFQDTVEVDSVESTDTTARVKMVRTPGAQYESNRKFEMDIVKNGSSVSVTLKEKTGWFSTKSMTCTLSF